MSVEWMFRRLLELDKNKMTETEEQREERKQLWTELMWVASKVDMPKTKNKSDLKLKKRKRR